MTTALTVLGSAHGKLVFSRRVRVLARAIASLVPDGRLVDVGCGDGAIAHAVSTLRPAVRPEGFDILVRTETRIPVTRFDGRHLPLADGAAAAVVLVDVLHHADDPVALLAECARVAPVVVVKDHLKANALDDRLLAFMDWVGNRPHGVVLPYTYFTKETWAAACAAAGLSTDERADVGDLYPFPFSLVFGRGLHMVERLVRR